MEFYRELIRRYQEGFDVIVDYTYDHTHPALIFNPNNYSIDKIMQRIDSGEYEYFNLRIRVFFAGKLFNQGKIEHCLERSVDDMLVKDCDIIEEFIETLIMEAREDIDKFKILIDKI